MFMGVNSYYWIVTNLQDNFLKKNMVLIRLRLKIMNFKVKKLFKKILKFPHIMESAQKKILSEIALILFLNLLKLIWKKCLCIQELF